MKFNRGEWIVMGVCILVLVFTAGFWLGRRNAGVSEVVVIRSK